MPVGAITYLRSGDCDKFQTFSFETGGHAFPGIREIELSILRSDWLGACVNGTSDAPSVSCRRIVLSGATASKAIKLPVHARFATYIM